MTDAAPLTRPLTARGTLPLTQPARRARALLRLLLRLPLRVAALLGRMILALGRAVEMAYVDPFSGPSPRRSHDRR